MNVPFRLLVFVVTIAWGLGLGATASAQSPAGVEESWLLERLGMPKSLLSDVHTRRVDLEALAMTVYEVKATVAGTGEAVGGTFDASGCKVDLGALRRMEVAARGSAAGGKLEQRLARRLAEAVAGESVPVVAWLHFDGAALDTFAATVMARLEPNAGMTSARALEAEVDDHVRSANAIVTSAAAAQLAALGVETAYVSTFAPAVFFDATPAQIEEIGHLPCVDTLYLQSQGGGLCNDDANATHRTTRVHQQGVRGRGVRFANIGGADPANPWLNVIATHNPGGTPSSHGTAVSGCVASTHPNRLGSAPDVDLYAANLVSLGDADITTAADWLATQNTDVSNMSWWILDDAVIHYQDRYFDYLSRYLLDSYVAAAGNTGGASNFVVTPAKGWNVLTVGAHTDDDDGDWTGDAMASFSSWSNPQTFVEKPNVAANGWNILTLDTVANGSLSGQVSGTSVASPHCAGNLCNAIIANNVVQTAPEAAMALMMGTAWHNIEGAAVSSGVDGAGGIHGAAAFNCARENRVTYQNVTSASFSTNGYFVKNVTLTGGDRTRICIAWSASVSGTYATATLDADLDLAVFQGANQTAGAYLGVSASYWNNFELVEFTPPVTGVYTIRIHDYAFNGASERVGIAWSQKYRDTACFQIRERTSETSALAGPTIGNAGYFMDVDAPNSPGAQFVCAPTATAPEAGPGLAVSPQTWLPLTPDPVTSLWEQDLADPGFNLWIDTTGILSADGTTATQRLAIPSEPAIVGLPIWQFGVTLEAGYPDGIKEISQPFDIRFWPLGTEKPRTDDGSFAQALPSGFQFYGTPYTQCWVNMNGNITFGGADGDFSESAAELLAGPPRIAFLWDDLDPSSNGNEGTPIVRVREVLSGPAQDQFVVIEFINVTEYSTTNANTVRVTLRGGTGAIDVEYRDCDLADCIVGISPGASLSSAASIDLTTSGETTSGTGDALYQVFSGSSAFDLSNTNQHWNRLRFTPNVLLQNDYRLTMDLE
jgi:Subtilase family